MRIDLRRLARAGITAVVAVSMCCGMTSVPLNRAAGASIKTIILLAPPPGTKQYDALSEQTVAAAWVGFAIGGIVGGLLSAGIARSPVEQKILDSLADESFQLPRKLREAIEGRLEEDGYQVEARYVAKRKPREFVSDYSELDYSADAYLDIAIGAIAYTDQLTKGMCPLLTVGARLVERRTERVLFAETYLYYCSNPKFEGVFIQVEPKYEFTDYRALGDNPEIVREALLAGVPLIADRIANALRKSP